MPHSCYWGTYVEVYKKKLYMKKKLFVEQKCFKRINAGNVLKTCKYIKRVDQRTFVFFLQYIAERLNINLIQPTHARTNLHT